MGRGKGTYAASKPIGCVSVVLASSLLNPGCNIFGSQIDRWEKTAPVSPVVVA